MQDIHHQRQFIIQGVVIAASLALVLKFFYLQVLNTSYQQQQSARQALTIYPSRGLIYDRFEKELVNNDATYDLMVTYNKVKNLDTTKFCELLGISKAEFIKNIEKDWGDYRFSKNSPYVFLKNISSKTYNRFAESMYEFPGFEGQLRNVRGYDVSVGAHVFGYISEVNENQIKKSEGIYKRGDYIGASGLELSYEEQLRGKKGINQVLIDNLGRMRGSYKNGEKDVPAESGLYLVTTLDSELQKFGEELMQNKKGSIVAIEPSTGEVLALVSAPNYDPNLLTIHRDRGAAFDALSKNDTLKPLLNRAIQSKYPPGSIFKPVMALIGLQEGVLTYDRAIACRGGYSYKRLFVGCHGHPAATDPGKAIQYSCNAYFCQTLRDIVDKYGFNNAEKGMNNLVEHLHTFGLGDRLGLDLPNESKGNIPTSEYYNKVYKKGRWSSPTIISIGIGQGEVETTPIQMCNIACIIANRGYYYKPHLLREFQASDEVKDKGLAKRKTDEALKEYRKKRYTKVEARHFDIVIKGMENVVLAGTATRSRITDIPMCGKTGTVENNHGKDHSTFIAFAPVDNPKIAVAVIVENGGFGAQYAAPIASLMIELYIRREISEQRKELQNRISSANLIGKP